MEKGKREMLWKPPPEGKAAVGVSLTVHSESMRKTYQKYPEGRKTFSGSFLYQLL